jgi:hypothetical protein
MERRRDDCDGRDSTSFYENRREGQGDNDGISPPDQVNRSSSRHDNGIPSPSGAPSPRPNEKRLSSFHRWKMECCDGRSHFAFRFFFGHCSSRWKGRWGALPCLPAVVRRVASSSVVRVEDPSPRPSTEEEEEGVAPGGAVVGILANPPSLRRRRRRRRLRHRRRVARGCARGSFTWR